MGPPRRRCRLLVVAALVVVAATLVATASSAATTPAHYSKTKKNCPASASACNLVTQAEFLPVSTAVTALVNAEQGIYASVRGSFVTDTSATAENPPTCDAPVQGGWGAGCSASPSNYLPQTVELVVQCPPEYFDAEQMICRAFVSDAEGQPIKTLAVVAQGSFSRWFTCVASTEGLPDGVAVNVEANVVCTGYVAPPSQQGAEGDGGSTTARADLAPPPHTLAAKLFGGGGIGGR